MIKLLTKTVTTDTLVAMYCDMENKYEELADYNDGGRNDELMDKIGEIQESIFQSLVKRLDGGLDEALRLVNAERAKIPE